MEVISIESLSSEPNSVAVPSGIACCGELHWGSHFCHLYETREDLIDTLVPFFSAGLTDNDKCLWVTSEPLDAVDATAALAEQIPDLQDYLRSGQLQIVDYSEWYSRTGKTDGDATLQGWIDAEQQALAEGYSGLRVTGNVTFINVARRMARIRAVRSARDRDLCWAPHYRLVQLSLGLDQGGRCA